MAMPQRDDTIETIKRLDDLLGYAVMHGDKIETGFKHDEYREVKPFWDKHFAGREGKELRSVTFMRGQASPVQATWKFSTSRRLNPPVAQATTSSNSERESNNKS